MRNFTEMLTPEALIGGFNRITNAIFAIMLFFITITMMVGVARLFHQLGSIVKYGGITGNYLHIFSDVLTLFILIELSRSLATYFIENRLRLTYILDAGIVFVLRDIMIGLFEHKLGSQEIYALSALMLVLGVLRLGSIFAYQREKSLALTTEEHIIAKKD